MCIGQNRGILKYCIVGQNRRSQRSLFCAESLESPSITLLERLLENPVLLFHLWAWLCKLSFWKDRLWRQATELCFSFRRRQGILHIIGEMSSAAPWKYLCVTLRAKAIKSNAYIPLHSLNRLSLLMKPLQQNGFERNILLTTVMSLDEGMLLFSPFTFSLVLH